MASIRVRGLEDLQKKLKKNVEMQTVKMVVKQNGAELQSKAQDYAPVGTPESTGIPGYIGGALKRSIGLEIKNNGLTARVAPTAEYAEYVEYGTRYMESQPYIRPAFEEQKRQFKSDMKKLMK